MKLLVLLAVLGAVSAQYQVYTGVSPYYHPYAAAPAPLPATYAAHVPVTYAAYPYIHGLPLSFKSAEEKAAEEAKPAVESRAKRSADEDQQADDATFVTTYAGHPGFPLAYSAGYAYAGHPAVYSSAYNPVTYHGCAYGVHGCTVYPGYTAPLVHSLKKRDTAAAEGDQQADDSTFVTTYGTHPVTYTAGYPSFGTYSAAYRAPVTYGAVAPAVTYSGFPYGYRYGFGGNFY